MKQQSHSPANSPRPAFFFDRDGIVNQRILGGYVADIDEFVFLQDFFPLFKQVKDVGFWAILVTNQQGVAKGLMSEADLASIHAFMQKRLKDETGTCFDDIFAATERDISSKSGSSGNRTAEQRRKPSPAMLLEAAQKWNISLTESWIIGDSRSDSDAGRAAGAKTILVGEFAGDEADIIVRSLGEARRHVENICKESNIM
jgi:D-glycero-D-manno-heptose 1,7-bisphosphate phosphatase